METLHRNSAPESTPESESLPFNTDHVHTTPASHDIFSVSELAGGRAASHQRIERQSILIGEMRQTIARLREFRQRLYVSD